MTTNKLFATKLANIKSQIKEAQREKNTASFLLFKDYLTKMFTWYEVLGIQNNWENYIFRTKEGHNLIHLIDPKFMDNLINLEDFRTDYLNDTYLHKIKHKGFEYIFVYYSIYWEIFKNESKFESYINLPNPYESVIKILTRGNHIYKGEMSTFEIDRLTIKNDLGFKLPSLDNDFLDYIDEVCLRSGSAGIPNQEKTNQLWEEFQKIKKNG